MATRQEVADRAGVSVAVVSYVLNNRKIVKEQTRQKVLEAVLALNYKPNLLARSLKTKKSKQIAVLVQFLGNPFEAGILLRIETVAKANGYFVFFQTYEEEQEERLKELFMGRVDGIILLGQALMKRLLEPTLEQVKSALPFRALVCANDLMAAGSLAACRELGVDVPGQLAIAGCEDILMSSQTNPPLTVIRFPRPEAAEAATLALFGIMDNQTLPEPDLRLQGELMIRESTAD
jgi:DNA-binding LacI/PurR family transcriptional regulator